MQRLTFHPIWLIVCCMLACAGVFVSTGIEFRWLNVHTWIWQAGETLNAPWTLWSGSLVGITPFHTFGNLLALLAVGVLGQSVNARLRDAVALLVAWPLTTLWLLRWSEVSWYAGLSGVIHAAVAIIFWRSIQQRSCFGIGLFLAAGLIFKLLLEHAWNTPIAFDFNWGFNVVYAAHLTGAIAGLACVMIIDKIAQLLGFPEVISY